jgi:hypothetical protein
MATPAYIKARIAEGLIKCVRLQKFSDGFSCEFQYSETGKKSLWPSTAKQATRTWLTHSEVMSYVTEQIGWQGSVYDHHSNKIQ